MPFTACLHKLGLGEDLSFAETKDLFDAIFTGEASESQVRAILLGLHNKGETAQEIRAAATAMREKMVTIRAPEGALDIVGTGGDGHGTYNVSTTAAFVAAGAGAIVAKHGNRAASSLSGSSDILAQLGVNLEAPLPIVEKALQEIGVAFLFAPRHHPAMRFVAPIRKALGVRTIFNLLGPLTNPARVKRHLIGVFDFRWAAPMAEVLAASGSEALWVAHARDGLDELSPSAPADIVEIVKGKKRDFTLTAADFGLPEASLESLKGGDAAHNAQAALRLFAGEKGPYRDITVMNAAAALILAGKAQTPLEAAKLAQTSIDSGAAKDKLDNLAKLTNP